MEKVRCENIPTEKKTLPALKICIQTLDFYFGLSIEHWHFVP